MYRNIETSDSITFCGSLQYFELKISLLWSKLFLWPSPSQIMPNHGINLDTSSLGWPNPNYPPIFSTPASNLFSCACSQKKRLDSTLLCYNTMPNRSQSQWILMCRGGYQKISRFKTLMPFQWICYVQLTFLYCGKCLNSTLLKINKMLWRWNGWKEIQLHSLGKKRYSFWALHIVYRIEIQRGISTN